MECLEFRRVKLSWPRKQSPELELHAAECAACAEFAKEADAFEEHLAQAVSVPVPEGLADRVLLNYKLQRGRRYGRYAIAAAMFLGLGLLMTYSQITRRDELTNAVIAHVLAEPEALQKVQNVPEDKLAQALAVNGGRLRGPIGEVRYLDHCRILGAKGEHIVFTTPYGVATLILLPLGKQVSEPQTLTRDGFSAAVLPAGRGNIGIVTDSPGKLEKVEQLLQQQVAWRS